MKVISYSVKVRDCPRKSATGLFADFCGHPRTYADSKKSAGVSRTFEDVLSAKILSAIGISAIGISRSEFRGHLRPFADVRGNRF